MLNKVYILDYDSVVTVCGGIGTKPLAEISRTKKTAIFVNKSSLIETLAEFSKEPLAIQNIEVSISLLEREKLDLDKLLNKE